MTTAMSVASALRRPAVPASVRLPLAVTVAPTAVAVIWLGIHYAGTIRASPVDDRLYSALDRFVPGPRWATYAIDWVGEPVGVFTVVIVIGTLCALLGRWRLALLAAAAQGLLGLASSLVKPLFDRTIHGGFLAYPSGHAAGGAAFGLVLALLLISVVDAGRAAGTAIVAVVTSVVGGLASWAQTLIVAHYPTDTIGGFCLALALVPPAGMLIDMIADRLLVPRLANGTSQVTAPNRTGVTAATSPASEVMSNCFTNRLSLRPAPGWQRKGRPRRRRRT